MIAGILHQGSGLGNQLHRLVASKVLATDKKCEWGMINPELFKGKDFMSIPIPQGIQGNLWTEKQVRSNGLDISPYDPEINFVQDGSVIDGEFQDPRYFEHRLDEVREWLEVEPLELPDDLCVIGFRGGEYKLYPDLFLPPQYWMQAMEMMSAKYPGIRFEVHTDDPNTASQFFGSHPVIHDVGINWRSVRYAKHLIIANSSFYILPSLLNENVKEVIAPRYWARHNTKIWALPQNYYKQFTYIHESSPDKF